MFVSILSNLEYFQFSDVPKAVVESAVVISKKTQKKKALKTTNQPNVRLLEQNGQISVSHVVSANTVIYSTVGGTMVTSSTGASTLVTSHRGNLKKLANTKGAVKNVQTKLNTVSTARSSEDDGTHDDADDDYDDDDEEYK